MPAFRTLKLLALLPLFAVPILAKDSKPILPPYILAGRTVAVVIDPEAGIDLHDPNANQDAQRNVEAALQKWGRFQVVLSTRQADLVIVLRKGHSKLADETIGDPRQNSRPGSITQTDDGVSIGAQHGQPPPLSGGQPPSGSQRNPNAQIGNTPQPKAEIGAVNDSFQVFDGKADNPLDGSPGWRWDRKDSLKSPSVPAVDEFRKAIAAAEQAAQAKHP